jgi:hypothetical protein
VKKSRKRRSRRLQYEPLEPRQLMAVTAGLSSSGVLTVTGSDGADTVNFKQTSDKISIGGLSGSWTASKVKSIVLNLKGGDDSVSLNSSANGGNQALAENVTINGSLGNNVAHLANGKDVHFSGANNWLYVGSNGTANMNGAWLNFSNSLVTSLANGVLTVYGTNANDNLKFLQSGGWFGLQGGVIGWFSAASVNSVVVRLQEGDDYFSLHSLANGGQEAFSKQFTVHSGDGDQTARLASGDDVTFSGWGHQLSVAANGSATLDGQAITTVDVLQASFSNGVLTVTGTNGNDDLRFLQSNGWFGLQGGVIGWFQASAVNSVVVNLRGGNDYVTLESLVNGGTQALTSTFTINSGAGNETVHLANGHDVAMNGAGHQLVASASGLVTLDGQVIYGDPDPPPPPPPTNWFDSNVVDAALRTLGHNLYTDGLIDRSDLIALLRSAQDSSAVDATELTDLRAIVANTSLFGAAESLWKLGSYVVNSNNANAKFQGQNLGNLAAGSTAAHLENLIGKWFLGLDRPTAGGAYRQTAGQLFVGGATYTDIKQGYLGDCYFVASLAETALKNPAAITNMFTVNGDGTYAVRFYNGPQSYYVTVDSYLPTDGAGRIIYAGLGMMYNNSGNELWTALAEKAYVQINEMGWLRTNLPGNGQNAYAAIEGGYIYAALGQITGQATTAFASTAASNGFSTFVSAFNAGKSIGFASKTTPASSSVVGSHAYAVVGYNAANQTVTLFNPWGVEYGLITMTWADIQGSFSYFDRTV